MRLEGTRAGSGPDPDARRTWGLGSGEKGDDEQHLEPQFNGMTFPSEWYPDRLPMFLASITPSGIWGRRVLSY